MSSKLTKLTRCLSGLLKAQLLMFQFKILHHILPTNATLHRFGIKEHNHCHLCAEKQTLARLFATCLMLSYFGHVLLTGGTEKNNTTITLSEEQILYGITDTLPRGLSLNLCIIIAKCYIYIALKMRKVISWMPFWLSLEIKY